MMNFSEISLINAMFIQFTVTAVIATAGLFDLCKPYLPQFVVQMLRYGKLNVGLNPNTSVSKLEVPKAWFKHFYVFAAIFSVIMCWMAVRLYIFNVPVPEWFITFLDIFCGIKREVRTEAFPTLMAMILITMQCLRRFYETHFIQSFSKTGSINVTHYLLAYLHYYGIILVILSQADGFVRRSNETPINKSLNLFQFLYCVPCIALFVYSWINQFESNVILANLRKDKSGQIISQKHKLPKGGYFEKVSSPHMYFEILMYISLEGLLYPNISWLYVVGWVVSNQIHIAILTHRWYKENFPEYPKSRTAVIPKFL